MEIDDQRTNDEQNPKKKKKLSILDQLFYENLQKDPDFRTKVSKMFDEIESKILELYQGEEEKIITHHEPEHIPRLIQEINRDRRLLYTITPRNFEEIVAELFRNRNFDVELTKQTRDGGHDLIAVKKMEGVCMRFIIECKHYALSRPVGIDIIRSIQ